MPNLRSVLMLRRQMDEESKVLKLGRSLTSLEVIEVELEVICDVILQERFAPNGEWGIHIWVWDSQCQLYLGLCLNNLAISS